MYWLTFPTVKKVPITMPAKAMAEIIFVVVIFILLSKQVFSRFEYYA